jgi:glycosyltransferase involved in cell wall biosynthesis
MSDYAVSLLLLAYKMESTMLDAIKSATEQTIPCEVIISDDASPAPDRGFEIAQTFAASYQGPHRLIVRKNEVNVGLCEHINQLVAIASGEFFLFMAADDLSYPDRAQKSVNFFREHPDVSLVGSLADEINERGELIKKSSRDMGFAVADQNKLLRCGKFVSILGATMAMRRHLLADLPPLKGMVEDNMITLRGSLFGPVHCVRDSWIQYRIHGGNLHTWVFNRDDSKDAKRKRYERTIKMYREIADDHERCINALSNLDPVKKKTAQLIVQMYRIEADAREAVLKHSRTHWLPHIWRGLKHPGLRRKAIERALKLFIPRRWAGL